MYAVIQTGGKQYKVTEGDIIYIEKLDTEPESEIKFDTVLMVSKDDVVKVGSPLLKNVSVDAKVLALGKSKKVVVYKYKPKKGYHKKQGHRQAYTKVQIEKINA